jgi:hypothetical protein
MRRPHQRRASQVAEQRVTLVRRQRGNRPLHTPLRLLLRCRFVGYRRAVDLVLSRKPAISPISYSLQAHCVIVAIRFAFLAVDNRPRGF